MKLSRRATLAGLASLPFAKFATAQMARTLSVESRTLEVKGKAAKVFGILGPGGKPGLEMVLGQSFRFNVKNTLDTPTLIHWHGLTPPSSQDGVPHLSGAVLAAGETRLYDFENNKAGSHWMHSHLGLQEQRLLAAPLIIRETAKPLFDEQEHVVMLHDFSFRDAQEILDGLKRANHSMPGMMNDVAYDALLANDRTLDDPEILKIAKAGQARLRIINAAAATNMWIELGELEGALIAVDGNTVLPVKAKRFPLAIAQRADIRITLPNTNGAWPILFQSEGDTLRAGLIIVAGDAQVNKISDRGLPGEALGFTLEAKLHALAQIPNEPTTQTEIIKLTGGDGNYDWGFNGTPMMHDTLFTVHQGDRIEITLHNTTAMAHPMHLHGHYFKVVGLNENRIDGAVRDTLLVPAGQHATIQFDANNPGTWAFHCHHLYHMNSGMMAAMSYASMG